MGRGEGGDVEGGGVGYADGSNRGLTCRPQIGPIYDRREKGDFLSHSRALLVSVS